MERKKKNGEWLTVMVSGYLSEKTLNGKEEEGW